MSCRATLHTGIISSKGLIPRMNLKEVLKDACEELNLTFDGRVLSAGNNPIGYITINDRVIITYEVFDPIIDQLRDCFTKRCKEVRNDYIFELGREKERLKQEERDIEELKRKLNKVDEAIKTSEEAMQRQTIDPCEALKLELTDAAKEKGYEVVEEKTEEGVQLQFVKVTY